MTVPALVPASAATNMVNQNLSARLDRLRSQGFVDLKVTAGRSSSAQDKLWVLNNVLRQYEEGRFQSDIISG